MPPYGYTQQLQRLREETIEELMSRFERQQELWNASREHDTLIGVLQEKILPLDHLELD